MTSSIREATPGAATVSSLFAEADAARASSASSEPAGTPPEIDPEAPHGRDETGEPLAPYGWTKPQRKDEKPRPKLAPGRPGKGDARLTDRPGPDGTPGKGKDQASKPEADREADYTGGLAAAHDAVWAGVTAVSKFGPRLPVVGRKVPGDKLGAVALIWHQNQAQLCGAVALAAKHNDAAARLAARFASDDVTWPIVCLGMVMPVAAAIGTVIAGDKQLAAADLPSTAELRAANDAAMEQQIRETMEHFQTLMEQAQQQQLTEAAA
jgi:hypothetical protein